MKRYAANNLLMGTVDKLHKLYGTENSLVVGMRSLGLRAVDGMGLVKGMLMDVAGGGRGGAGARY
jgi:ubiquinone biosynthesis monooxygenase Coq6